MATSYKNQGAGYASGTEIGQGAWQDSGASLIGGTVGITAGGDLTCLGSSAAGSGTVTITVGGDVILAGLSGRLGTVGITGNGNLTFPHKAWGSMGITAGGALNFTVKVKKTGVVTVEGNGLLVGAYLKNLRVEKRWLNSAMAQGVIGTSILKRAVRK